MTVRDQTSEAGCVCDALAPAPTAVGEGLRNEQADIRYQPKIDLRRKCLVGAEAFAGVGEAQSGDLCPPDALPDIDADGLIAPTERALLAVLRDWTAFAEDGFNLHLAIDVPAGALSKRSLPQLVRENRPCAESWPGLILEIGEERMVRDIALVQGVAAELKSCGIGIAIDNFGAGYSSFSSLRALPFAELKIDSQFVKDCATDANNAAICQTAIDLAHRFGSVAVACGIANRADLEALAVMGCDVGQGPLVAPPMPREDFLELLRRRMNRPKPPATEAADAGESVA